MDREDWTDEDWELWARNEYYECPQCGELLCHGGCDGRGKVVNRIYLVPYDEMDRFRDKFVVLREDGNQFIIETVKYENMKNKLKGFNVERIIKRGVKRRVNEIPDSDED